MHWSGLDFYFFSVRFHLHLNGIQSINYFQIMDSGELLQRITFDHSVLTGKPVIRGMRISVEMILELLAKGATVQEILEDYPELESEDIRAALMYAKRLVSGEEIADTV